MGNRIRWGIRRRRRGGLQELEGFVVGMALKKPPKRFVEWFAAFRCHGKEGRARAEFQVVGIRKNRRDIFAGTQTARVHSRSRSPRTGCARYALASAKEDMA